eukprot:79807-Chlamydomonas_euryale.AAC.2
MCRRNDSTVERPFVSPAPSNSAQTTQSVENRYNRQGCLGAKLVALPSSGSSRATADAAFHKQRLMRLLTNNG